MGDVHGRTGTGETMMRCLAIAVVLLLCIAPARAEYYDYDLQFPVDQLPRALEALAALRTAGVLAAGALPENMLGSPRDDAGNIVPQDQATWRGEIGRPATSYADPDTGQTVTVPAVGPQGSYCVAIRTTLAPNELPFDPADYGMTSSDTPPAGTPANETCHALLGVWQ